MKGDFYICQRRKRFFTRYPFEIDGLRVLPVNWGSNPFPGAIFKLR
jgi:hypothetical protein